MESLPSHREFHKDCSLPVNRKKSVSHYYKTILEVIQPTHRTGQELANKQEGL